MPGVFLCQSAATRGQNSFRSVDAGGALIVYYVGDIPSDVYTEAFQNLYEGGKAGLSFSKAAAGNAYSEYLSDGAAEAAYQAGRAAYDGGAKSNVLAFGQGEAAANQNNLPITVGQSQSVDEEGQSGYNEGEVAQKGGVTGGRGGRRFRF